MTDGMPNLSKNQVKKAGKVLKDKNASLVERDQAFDVLSEWRSRHVHPLKVAYNLLRRNVLKYEATPIFGQRLKRAPSIIAKLNRFPSGLGEMQDIAGCRVVVKDYETLKKIDAQLIKSPSVDQARGKDYILYPKDDGYRGIHRIYRYKGKEVSAQNLPVEIQLRTTLQHSWATTVEIIDTFESQSLKIGGGTQDWKRFFYLMSNEFAKLEHLPSIDVGGGINELGQLEHKLKALDKLVSFNVTIKETLKKENSKNAFVLALSDKETKSIEIFGLSDYEIAKRLYITFEKNYVGGDGRYDVVLINGASLHELKKSYPNYFADSQLFSETLNKILTNEKG